ncbi:TetR/AcrR family transcriptional regulator [Saccharothrix variisporea]|uniref:TetR family transcriptional regulator n=1 Tax=Saccharothrix variisporea TaxID=543527 RepID=A0A495X4S4_9PSEU|nr:TetR/AcrR family transcriptional regulator [Saccharothrix variisporea]RKT68990.1 TetR family transcriptional regulator [Saccharothrix variisporea]
MSRPYAGISQDERRRQRRDRLLLAALDLFTTQGFAQTKIAALCTAAGVSTRNFYEEFKNKERLLLLLHDRVNALALERVTTALAALESRDPGTRISTLLDAFVSSVTADPRVPRLAYVEAVGVNAELERQHQEWVARWADFIEAEARHAAEQGFAPQRDFHLTAIALVGAVTGLLREWQAHDPPLDVADIATEIKSLMLAAITR